MKEDVGRRDIESGYLLKADLSSHFTPHKEEFSKALG